MVAVGRKCSVTHVGDVAGCRHIKQNLECNFCNNYLLAFACCWAAMCGGSDSLSLLGFNVIVQVDGDSAAGNTSRRFGVFGWLTLTYREL